MTISKRSELKWAGVKEENTNTFIRSLLKFIEYLVNNHIDYSMIDCKKRIQSSLFILPRPVKPLSIA